MTLLADDLKDTHSSLVPSTDSSGDLVAHEIFDRPGIYIGRDSNSHFLVLFEEIHVDPKPAMKYDKLRIEFSTQYKLEISGAIVQKAFTLVKLTSNEPEFIDMFTTVMASLINVLPLEFTTVEIRSLVTKVTDLFRPAPRLARSAVVGLFGELSLIRHAEDPNTLAAAWHSSPLAKSDFSLESYFIEVKTTEGNQRVHKLRAHQLEQPEKDILLASIKVTEDESGINLRELLAITLGLVTPTHQAHIIEVFYKTVGIEHDELSELRFSLLGGSSEIFLFESKLLPSATPQTDKFGSAISNIEFQMNFDILMNLGIDYKSFDNFGI